jgi:outer membrane protein TolC
MKINIRHKRIITTLHLNLFLFISTYFYLFQPISAFSQTDSLLHYLDVTAKNNPEVLQRYYEYQAALKKVPQVGSLPDPELSVGVFLSPMELVGGSQVADFRLMQMFPWFGVLKYGKDEMSLMAMAKYEAMRDTKLQLFFEVQQSWYQLYQTQKEAEITKANIDLLKTIERLSLVKYSSGNIAKPANAGANVLPAGNVTVAGIATSGMGGMASGGANGNNAGQSSPGAGMGGGNMGASGNKIGLADIYRIQMEIGELTNSLDELKSLERTQTAAFNAYLNRAPSSPVATTDQLFADTLGMDMAAIPDSMMANHPMLGMLRYEQQSFEAKQKMASRMGYPMVGLGLNYSLINKSDMSSSSMNGKDMVMPMVTVTLPIYRKKYRSQVEEAALMKASNQAGLNATANNLQTDYYRATQAYLDAQRRLKLYDSQCDLAQKTLDIQTKAFSANGSDLSELLRTRQQMLDYDTKHLEALVEYNTAIAWLKRLSAIQPTPSFR